MKSDGINEYRVTIAETRPLEFVVRADYEDEARDEALDMWENGYGAVSGERRLEIVVRTIAEDM